jgi:hypothetical protein
MALIMANPWNLVYYYYYCHATDLCRKRKMGKSGFIMGKSGLKK